MESVCFHASAALALSFHNMHGTRWHFGHSCTTFPAVLIGFYFFSYLSLTCGYVSAPSTERVVHQLVNVGIHVSYRIEQCGLPLPRLPIRRIPCI